MIGIVFETKGRSDDLRFDNYVLQSCIVYDCLLEIQTGVQHFHKQEKDGAHEEEPLEVNYSVHSEVEIMAFREKDKRIFEVQKFERCKCFQYF